MGIFPDILKIAKLTPHKKECKLNFQNYTPISLLSVFSKIFEKTMYSRIYFYLTKPNLIFNKQFGFCSNYSTNHALLSITESIKELIDSSNYVCGVFVDLEKAFDTVNYKILCEKLDYYGLRGNVNKLIESYLAIIKQYVSISGFESNLRDTLMWSSSGLFTRPIIILNIH